MRERFAMLTPDPWVELSEDDYIRLWERFDATFGFRAGMDPDAWPAIREPVTSVTFDLSSFQVGLDWQHPAYRFFRRHQALTWLAEWKVPVFPDGDYYAFLTSDLSEGAFGHPWERTLCVIGRRMVDSLARSLSTWLPTKREIGASA